MSFGWKQTPTYNTILDHMTKEYEQDGWPDSNIIYAKAGWSLGKPPIISNTEKLKKIAQTKSADRLTLCVTDCESYASLEMLRSLPDHDKTLIGALIGQVCTIDPTKKAIILEGIEDKRTFDILGINLSDPDNSEQFDQGGRLYMHQQYLTCLLLSSAGVLYERIVNQQDGLVAYEWFTIEGTDPNESQGL